MKKEVVCFIETSEEDTLVSVQRVSDDTKFVLLKLGGFAVAIHRAELLDALNTVSFYGTLFDEEKNREANRASLEESRRIAALKQSAEPQPPPKELLLSDRDFDKVEAELAKPTKTKPRKVNPEDKDALIIDVPNRTGPTASEKKLAEMMEKMNGTGTLILTEK